MASSKRPRGCPIKLRRYRQKQLRNRVSNPDNRPEFAAEAKRQGLALRGRAEEVEALGFIGSVEAHEIFGEG